MENNTSITDDSIEKYNKRKLEIKLKLGADKEIIN